MSANCFNTLSCLRPITICTIYASNNTANDMRQRLTDAMTLIMNQATDMGLHGVVLKHRDIFYFASRKRWNIPWNWSRQLIFFSISLQSLHRTVSKLVPVVTQASRHEEVWGSGSIAPHILWPRQYTEFSGQLHDPAALPQGKSPWYPLDRRLGGLQSQSGCGGGEENSQPLPGLEPPIIQPAAQRYTIELHGAKFTSN
jgi:hypothetical protein